jgi:hypothetical protein
MRGLTSLLKLRIPLELFLVLRQVLPLLLLVVLLQLVLQLVQLVQLRPRMIRWL